MKRPCTVLSIHRYLTFAAVGSMLWTAERASMWKLPGTRFTMMKPDSWHPA